MLQECIKNLPILFACIVANIAAGTLASVSIDKISFDKKVLVDGIARAIIVAVGIVVLAYAFDKVDLSGLGYTPATVVSTGILVYAAKLLGNIVKLIGLSDKFPNISTKNRLSKLESQVVTIEENQSKQQNATTTVEEHKESTVESVG